MSHEPTVIYSAANTQQAHLLRGLLEQEGISASVVNDAIQIAGGDLPVGWTAAPRIVVAEEDAQAARRLAEEFDRRTAHEPSDDEAGEVEDLPLWADWPVCPQCGERRAARCPVCGVSRADFLLADVQENASQQHVLLKCDDCDDLIRPEWYRRCARCGYDYGAGIDVAPAAAESGTSAALLRMVVLALLAVASVLVAYFAWLLNSAR